MTVGTVVSEAGGPAGHSYRALVVRGAREQVLAACRAVRLSGWVGPQEGPWVVVVPSGRHLVVAADGRDLEELGRAVLERGADGPVLVVEVVRDRLLSLVLLTGEESEQPPRYLSDPSVLDPDDFEEPRGAHHAGTLARALGTPDAAGELRGVLAEWLDPEHYIESERLGRVLAMLGLPLWLVSAWRLPRPLSTGPRPQDLTRLRAGRPGPVGLLPGLLADRGRRLSQRVRRRPDGPRPDGAAVPSPDEPW